MNSYSTGASNRIEGNRLSDEEVEVLYQNLRIRRFKTRDEQEVAGYLEYWSASSNPTRKYR